MPDMVFPPLLSNNGFEWKLPLQAVGVNWNK